MHHGDVDAITAIFSSPNHACRDEQNLPRVAHAFALHLQSKYNSRDSCGRSQNLGFDQSTNLVVCIPSIIQSPLHDFSQSTQVRRMSAYALLARDRLRFQEQGLPVCTIQSSIDLIDANTYRSLLNTLSARHMAIVRYLH